MGEGCNICGREVGCEMRVYTETLLGLPVGGREQVFAGAIPTTTLAERTGMR